MSSKPKTQKKRSLLKSITLILAGFSLFALIGFIILFLVIAVNWSYIFHKWYDVREDGVYYQYYEKDKGPTEFKLEEIDPGTFKELTCSYIKDKDAIYLKVPYEHKDKYYGKDPYNEIYKLELADLDSFKIINCKYAKDKNNVYAEGIALENADPKSFKILKRDYEKYAKDKNQAYYDGEIITGADPESFEVLQPIYSKDKNHVYHDANIIEKADPKSFEVLNFYYARDKSYVYLNGKYQEGRDPHTFELLNIDQHKFNKDRSGVYIQKRGDQEERVDKIDTETIKFLNPKSLKNRVENYIMDKNGVYFLSGEDNHIQIQKIEGADPKTFELVLIKNGLYISKDNQYVFNETEKIKDVDAGSFQFMNPKTITFWRNFRLKTKDDSGDFENLMQSWQEYVMDKNGIYLVDYYKNSTQKLEGADPKDFTILLAGGKNSLFSKSKNFSYFRGQKIENLDLETFELLNEYYAKDKNQVYLIIYNYKDGEWKLVIKKNIDPATFEFFRSYVDFQIIKDAHGVECKKGEEWIPLKNVDAKNFKQIDSPRYFYDGNNYYDYCERIEKWELPDRTIKRMNIEASKEMN